jgi:hypothetical protein
MLKYYDRVTKLIKRIPQAKREVVQDKEEKAASAEMVDLDKIN